MRAASGSWSRLAFGALTLAFGALALGCAAPVYDPRCEPEGDVEPIRSHAEIRLSGDCAAGERHVVCRDGGGVRVWAYRI